MPSHRGKINDRQARGLVVHVRGFAPNFKTQEKGEETGLAMASFRERFRRLQEQQDELHRQYRELSQVSRGEAQSRPSESAQFDTAQEAAQAAKSSAPAGELFRKRCVKCHETDGTGSSQRHRLPEIPDFTDTVWQTRRADRELLKSILDGKGSDMPPQRGKIGEKQGRILVSYVRAFSPSATQFKHADRAIERQAPAPVHRNPQAESPKPLQDPVPRLRAPEKSEPSAPEALFRRHCVKCHGSDGTGNKKRSRWPEIPDFTDAFWQARRTNAELTESVLDGKGSAMPPFGDDMGQEPASGLVVYIRAFAPVKGQRSEHGQDGLPLAATLGDSKQGQQGRPTPAEPSQGETTPSFFDKLTRWLGKFHPPATHFPVALLMSAAVAELLRVATGKPVFDGISRFCIWFGSLTAVAAAVLGWCAGSFRMTDASWVLMTHRWLGTSTVAFAALVLVLSEASRSADRHRTRICFRVVLLVVAVLVSATGFLGGAAVFGLKHYAWPQ
jgi:mono/diheme cytochrome c family protein/uncharacterized membrane protein